jgi:hypothetical protein
MATDRFEWLLGPLSALPTEVKYRPRRSQSLARLKLACPKWLSFTRTRREQVVNWLIMLQIVTPYNQESWTGYYICRQYAQGILKCPTTRLNAFKSMSSPLDGTLHS